MSPLLFLGAAAVVFFVGTLVIWVFTRERKTSFNSSIEDFRAGLDAIAPDAKRKRNERKREMYYWRNVQKKRITFSFL